jgi:branched-chain amino acid transport system ATP-binding protein
MSSELAVEGLAGGYGALTVFRDVRFSLERGTLLGILGPNGAGKTTLLKTLIGLLPAHAGRVFLRGADLTALPAFGRVRRGLALVPEGRQMIAALSVAENLELSRAKTRLNAAAYLEARTRVLSGFPRLEERLAQPAGALSGGEQQMLAIARAMLLEPQVMLLDEPTQGLAPVMVRQVLEALLRLRGQYALVVVEQNRSFLEALTPRIATMRGGQLDAD